MSEPQAGPTQKGPPGEAGGPPGGAGSDKEQRPSGMGRQMVRSVLRHGCEDTVQNRLLVVASNLWLHIHPARIPRDALRLRFTLCAGGIAFFLFLVTVVTGLILMIHYVPSVSAAHGTVTALGQRVPYGAFLRSLHRYAGDGMILMVLVHLVRVLLAGAYRPPRELNWVVGVVLLVLTLAIAFTGYLLPWDQKGFWATTVAAHMVGAMPLAGAEGPAALPGPRSDLRAAILGGQAVGPSTLLRFYVLHCLALPLALVLLLALHFWRVRKDGISGPL